MAYYTGTEVKVWIQTEHDSRGIQINANQLEMVNNSGDASYDQKEIYGRSLIGKVGFNLPDITGVDLSTGAQDEEISYFGTKTPGKIETKADMSVTLTRKKSDKTFSTLAQGDTASGKSFGSGGHAGRHGLVITSGSTSIGDMVISDGTVDPKSSTDETGAVCYGYRIAIQLKGGSTTSASDGTIIVLRNCTMGQYTTTMSNDTANEETLEFVSMVKPLVLNGKMDGAAFDGGNTATLAADM